MRVLIATDYSVSTYKGKYYYDSPFYKILSRYYSSFGKVVICTRIVELDKVSDNTYDATNMIEKVIPVNSLMDAFTGNIKKSIKSELQNCDLVVARIPSIIAYRAAECAKEINMPYLSETMGCAWDAYWNHGFIGKLIAPYMFYKMKRCAANANYALYVTEKYLQKKYPCKGLCVNASNVNINIEENAISNKLAQYKERENSKHIILLTAAAVDVRYKGQEYVIKALPTLKKMGINAEYRLAGGGDQSFLTEVAKKNDVLNQVKFLGRLSNEEVLKQMDDADIYIQPSLQEGLPRSMIEAMSRACVCLGARTAGIPELINDEFVFRRKSVKDIVKHVKMVCEKIDIESEAMRNYQKSKEYEDIVLQERRNMFYAEIIADINNRRKRHE